MSLVKLEKPDKTKHSLPPTGGRVPRAVRLKTVQDLRRFGSKVINKLLRGEINEGQARAYGYLLSILKDLIQTGDLESRIQALETQIKGDQR